MNVGRSYSGFNGNVGSFRPNGMVSASGNDAWVIGASIGTNVSDSSVVRAVLESASGASNFLSTDKKSTRSGSATASPVNGYSADGNAKVFFAGGVRGCTGCCRYHPPRPWACLYTQNQDVLYILGIINLNNPSQDLIVCWVEEPPTKPSYTFGRRPRRRGLYSYRNYHQATAPNVNDACKMIIDNTYVFYTLSPPRRQQSSFISSTIRPLENIDAALIATVTSVTSVDIAAYVDAGTVSGVTTPSGVDELPTIYTDFATISSKTAPSSSELHEIFDSAIVTSVTTPSGIDIKALNAIETATISTTTRITSVDRGPFTDTAVIKSVTSVTGPDDSPEDYVHPAGSWGPFDDDDGIMPLG